MRPRIVGLLALALTSSAIASAALARSDPPYDDDLALTELASREYHFENETDVALPTVHCVRSEATEETKGATSIVVGRHHLGVEGREVMKLSVDPVADI